jgi:hypothetical protein
MRTAMTKTIRVLYRYSKYANPSIENRFLEEAVGDRGGVSRLRWRLLRKLTPPLAANSGNSRLALD